MCNRPEAERLERFDPRQEPRTDHDRVGVGRPEPIEHGVVRLDVREPVHEARGGKDATSDDRMTAEELDTQTVAVGAGHATDVTGQDLPP